MAEPVTCEVCSQRAARLLMVRRKRGELYRTFVCSECAAERARLYGGSSLDLRHITLGWETHPWIADSQVCELCGADLTGAGTDVQPGCCECYARFPDVFRKAVHEVQGHVKHLGKSPVR